MAVTEVLVEHKSPNDDIDGKGWTVETHRTLGIEGVEIETARIFYLEGSKRGARRIARRLPLFNPITQKIRYNPEYKNSPFEVIVGKRPGVTDSAASFIQEGSINLKVKLAEMSTATRYRFKGNITEERVRQIVESLLVNPTTEQVITARPDTLIIEGDPAPTEFIDIREMTHEQLLQLSHDRQLQLELPELLAIQEYFRKKGRAASDLELDGIAALWSDHCSHKTFKADLIINGQKEKPLFTQIIEASREVFDEEVLSAFSDNAGIILFFDGWALAIKAETHNSPSAVEPFGGAGTGVGGNLRDLMAAGQGSKPILNVYILAFAPPDQRKEDIPENCWPPDYLLRKVVKGIENYGNSMGVPTPIGTTIHDEGFVKPLVLVAGVGLLRAEHAKKQTADVGDLILLVGGRTGRDGIHGATFSSVAMTEQTKVVNATSVQIGNPIEEKRVMDALLECRDRGFIKRNNDLGAGGIFTAVGEMGAEQGVTINLDRVKTKYSGLANREKALSESQERMTFTIDPNHLDEVQAIFTKHRVEATVIGKLDGTKTFNLYDRNQKVGELDFDFLKDGQPRKTLEGKWVKPNIQKQIPDMPTDWQSLFSTVLSDWNICSKEPIVRQYDHGVQAIVKLSPFTGVNQDGPNKATVIAPLPDKDYGFVFSYGLYPQLNRLDPYNGTLYAAVEAAQNYVAVGGNPRKMKLLNNYYEPPATNEQNVGSLYLQVKAVADFVGKTKSGVVSGKDSMGGRFKSKDKVIEIPPTINISVIGNVENVKKTVSSDIKNNNGSILCLVGGMDDKMGASTYYRRMNGADPEIPKVDLDQTIQVFDSIHSAIKSSQVLACQGVSKGGLATTLTEMLIGGDCGANLDINFEGKRVDLALFNETPGRFVVEVQDEETAQQLFKDVPFQIVGKTIPEKQLTVRSDGTHLFDINVAELTDAWKQPMQGVFH